MLTNNSKLILLLKNHLREIFDEEVSKTYLKVPKHFDMSVDSFLVGNIIYYSQEFHNGNIYDTQTKKVVLEHIYKTNIEKIIKVAIKPETIPHTHPFGLVHNDALEAIIAEDYIHLAYDTKKCVILIQNIIDDTITELELVKKSYKDYFDKKGKLRCHENSFINCFIHPYPLINYSEEVYFDFQEQIIHVGEPFFRSLTKRFIEFINSFLYEIRK